MTTDSLPVGQAPETKAVRLLNRLFSYRNIVNCDRDIYLRRWFIVRSKRFGFFIHKFERSDEDRALHDHPWNFLVIPIWRGYVEHYDRKGVRETRRVLPILGSRYRKGTYKHRVELIDGLPAWSIFIRFRKWRDWGFHMPNGWVQWQLFWRQNCE